MWQVEDGKQMARMEAECVWCLAVSKDGRWIAAGTGWGDMFVWDAKTYEKVFSHRDSGSIRAVDFSLDSTRLISASSNGTASIWDIATRKKVQILEHGDVMRAAKYSPQGDRIVTATKNFVRLWDSDNGSLLMSLPVKVTPLFGTGLLWFNNHLFVISGSTIKQFEASTGLAVSEWPVPDSTNLSCIALPKHGKFIAYYSTQRTVTFWDTVTHTQLGLIQYPQDIHSIALSPDDRLLAIGREDGNITINNLSRITVRILSRWIVVRMNNFLAPIIFHRIQSLCLVYTRHSRNQKFRSTTLRSILGSTINSQTRKHY